MAAVEILTEGQVLSIVLNRPERRNAFDREMVVEITKAVRTMKASVRVIVIKGNGKNFSSGADLRWMQSSAELPDKKNKQEAGIIYELYASLVSVPVPILCRAHGDNYGGGVGLIAACDLVLADEKSSFTLSEAKVGLVPGIITPLIVRRVGVSQFLRMALTAEKIEAAEALRIGLVHSIYAPSESENALARQIKTILSCAPKSLRQIKKLALSVKTLSKQDLISSIADKRKDDEARAGLNAFLRRQPPPWI